MAERKPDRDYVVIDFQVGIGPNCVAVELALATGAQLEQSLGEAVIVRLAPEMARVLSRHLKEASMAAAMGAAPTRTPQ